MRDRSSTYQWILRGIAWLWDENDRRVMAPLRHGLGGGKYTGQWVGVAGGGQHRSQRE